MGTEGCGDVGSQICAFWTHFLPKLLKNAGMGSLWGLYRASIGSGGFDTVLWVPYEVLHGLYGVRGSLWGLIGSGGFDRVLMGS